MEQVQNERISNDTKYEQQMSTRRSHSRSNNSYDESNNNIIDPNSLTAFQRLWCVAHTLSWLHVPELARARRVNSTFLDAVDGGYVAQPFIHLVETVYRLRSSLQSHFPLSCEMTPPDLWRYQRRYGYSVFDREGPPMNPCFKAALQLDHPLVNLIKAAVPTVNAQGSAKLMVRRHCRDCSVSFLFELVRDAIIDRNKAALTVLYRELGASRRMVEDVYDFAAEDSDITAHLAELGVADRCPQRTVGIALHRGDSPDLIANLLTNSMKSSADYSEICDTFFPHYDYSRKVKPPGFQGRDHRKYAWQDVNERGSPAAERRHPESFQDWALDTMASAAVRRCAYTWRCCEVGSAERKVALENLQLVILFEQGVVDSRRQARAASHQQHEHADEECDEECDDDDAQYSGDEDNDDNADDGDDADAGERYVSPIHLAAANRDYEALEMILNCDFAFGSGAGINALGSAGRCGKFGRNLQHIKGFVVHGSRQTPLAHACFEQTSFMDAHECFASKRFDQAETVIPVVVLLLQHGACWSGYNAEGISPPEFLQHLPTPAMYLAADPRHVKLLCDHVKQIFTRSGGLEACISYLSLECDVNWHLKPWNCDEYGDLDFDRTWYCDCDDDLMRSSWEKARRKPRGTSVLSVAIATGDLNYVRTLVTALRAAFKLRLPRKVVHGQRKVPSDQLGRWFGDDEEDEECAECDSYASSCSESRCIRDFESDETQFYDLELPPGKRAYRWERGVMPRPAVIVDPDTGIESVIYDVNCNAEYQHRWFLTQAYDMDPTPTKEIHAWFREFCKPPVTSTQQEAEECEEADADDVCEEGEVGDE